MTPELPPDWLVRAELRDLAHLPRDHPERIRRFRALYGYPGANPEPPELESAGPGE
jgi:hypothetical protein